MLSRLGTLASRLGRRWSRSAPAAGRETPEEIKDFDHASVVLERILLTNLLPFWRSQVGDERSFGYLTTNPDVRAQPGASLRGIVTQARTLWFFARIMQTPFADDADGRQAERGFTFLAKRMWDHRHGGFYWHIDDQGRPVRGSKQLYGHAFALFALSRYAAASESPRAIDLAHATFELLEQRFHDHDHPGYHEFFTADWREPPQLEKSQIGSPAGCKTYNSHLHVLEAFIEYRLIADTPLLRSRIEELCAILTGPVVRRPEFAAADLHLRDWRPALPSERERTSYAHDLESVHLLIAAQKALGKG